MLCMKKRINLSLSEEAVAVLARSDNMSQFVEDLILEKTPSKENTNSSVTEGRVLYLIQQELAKIKPQAYNQPTVVSQPDKLPIGMACCLSGKCIHWQWDELELRNINTLTGEVREA